ncbi:MAG: hypothetical protein Q9206_005388 [Seirophora lacunosa]
MGGHRNTSCISYQGIWKPDGPEIGPEILPPVKELDRPRETKVGSLLDWRLHTQKLENTRRLLSSDDEWLKWKNIGTIAESVKHLLQTPIVSCFSSLNLDFLARFTLPANYYPLLCQSTLHRWACKHPIITIFADQLDYETQYLKTDFHIPYPTSDPESKISAQLYCLRGPVIVLDDDEPYSHGDRRTVECARSRIDDPTMYTEANRGGPFHDDGSLKVDWEKLEVVQRVLAARLQAFVKEGCPDEAKNSIIPDAWIYEFHGARPNTFVSPTVREREAPFDAQDPYNITGTWILCLCYQMERFPFRTHPPPRYPEGQLQFSKFELRVTGVEPAPASEASGLPTVHFLGTEDVTQLMYGTMHPHHVKGMWFRAQLRVTVRS